MVWVMVSDQINNMLLIYKVLGTELGLVKCDSATCDNIRVIHKVSRLGGENSQFRHIRPSNA
jgi:hypothetical protein